MRSFPHVGPNSHTWFWAGGGGLLTEKNIFGVRDVGRAAEVGWRDIPPMWTVPGQAFRGIRENITFGMTVDHWHKEHGSQLRASQGHPL